MSLPITLAAIRAWPKSDLHNHCMLGGKRSVIEKFYGRKFGRFKALKPGIADLNQYIIREVRPFFEMPGGFEKGVEAAFLQARKDGVVKLEMSIDVSFGTLFKISPGHIVSTLNHFHTLIAPTIDFRPELGFARPVPLRTLLARFEPYLGFDYFRSIDLYDDEGAQPLKNFRELYSIARQLGMKCKAHAGEFGSAESVRETVEVLELDAVQHGIGAAESPAVMNWLADRAIPLNVCPASNIQLKRVISYKTHPIRILFDHGVKVTVNTDDALIFGAGVSEQLFKLFQSGLFSKAELDIIRRNGLENPVSGAIPVPDNKNR